MYESKFGFWENILRLLVLFVPYNFRRRRMHQYRVIFLSLLKRSTSAQNLFESFPTSSFLRFLVTPLLSLRNFSSWVPLVSFAVHLIKTIVLCVLLRYLVIINFYCSSYSLLISYNLKKPVWFNDKHQKFLVRLNRCH